MKRKKKFTYRDMKDVFLIVLLEKSTPEFHTLSCEARQPQSCITGCPEYIHRGEMRFDTGLQLNTLQKYVLVPLDIYKGNKQNEDIKDELDAWLAF